MKRSSWPTCDKQTLEQRTVVMRDMKLDSRATYATFGSRRARRAERQALVSTVLFAGAFIFVSAVVFGFVG